MSSYANAYGLILAHVRRLGAIARTSSPNDLRVRRAAAVAMDAYGSLAVQYLQSLGEFHLTVTALESGIAREIRLVDDYWHADSEWIRTLAIPAPVSGLVP